MNYSEILFQIKGKINQISPTAQVYLYGSVARGDTSIDSDIDLLILLDSNQEKLSYHEIIDITFPLYDIEFQTGVSINPLVYTRKQWENRPIKTPFFVNVMNERMLL